MVATTPAAPAGASTKPDASMERTRKKLRVSPSPAISSSTAASATATATATAVASSSLSSSSAGSRLKSGLLPPTAVGSSSSSRLHYAFGSRLPPMSGKENAPANSATATKATGGSRRDAAHDALHKKQEPPKSALKRRPTKKRPSITSDEPTGANATATMATPSGKPKVPTVKTPSTPAVCDTEEKETKANQTTPTPVVGNKTATPVALSPFKPVRFAATSATDPDFWKCRQQFARTAMVQLKDLEDRLNTLSESPSLPFL